MQKKENRRVVLAVALAVLLSACSRRSPEDVVATVGSEVLTREMVAERAGVPYDSLSLTTKQQIAQDWIEETLLLWEAERRGLQRDPTLARKLGELRRELLRSRLVQSVQAQQVPSDSAIGRYYQEHQTEFVRAQEEYEIELYWAPDLVTAQLFRRAARDDMDLAEMAYPNVSMEGIWRVTAGDLPSDETAELASLKVGQVADPRPSEEGYRLMRLRTRWAAGEPVSLDDVRYEIRERMMIESARIAMESLLAELSRKYPTTIHLGDSL
ncbi:MAG: peptidylprolyl isomerase [bacterium]